jgi:hypothetical protein
MLKITDIINKQTKDYKAVFSCYRSGHLYYDIVDSHSKALYQFPVDITDTHDIGGATFGKEYKAITMMRYIRKALAKGDLISLRA